MLVKCLLVTLLALLPLLAQVEGHMSLQEPPARNVLWRMGYPLPPHDQDDYLICTHKPHAPCPPCGDSFDDPLPHAHERGGKWATDIIPRTYTVGQVIPVEVNVTRSHGGELEFRLCPHDDRSRPVSQECLDLHRLSVVGHRSRAMITAPYDSQQMITFELQLPSDMTCDRCVLQMTNKAEQFLPQTILFRNCADITIVGALNAKTNHAAGPPRPFNPLPFAISTRNQPPPHLQDQPFPEQKQHRFFLGSNRHLG